MTRILLTTTSYQDCPGDHHALLESTGAEIVRERGPLSEARMLELAGEFDAFLCGDDEITQAVIEKSLPRLKIIAKYGIGVDKIDVAYASEQNIPVSFTPGVNHTTVSEHVFMLLLALNKNLMPQATTTATGGWKRMTGHEIFGKTIGIIGLGRIGREVAIRANAFGMKCVGYDLYWPEDFAKEHNIERMENVTETLKVSDIVSLHTNLTEETRDMINASSIQDMKDGAILINCGRGELTVTADIAAALESGKLGGYGADVLDEEPPRPDHPLLGATNCIITPHVGSRTYESVQRQAGMATENLVLLLKGEKALAQVNDATPPAALI
ncbi:NAD(P)-dependent oxidoreductase [Coraliomargarita akajimensis]|uniref:D-isomer specific 2-hydroxyacid dehydrogenase NAD-binding protein n=1 Tax=Coraliomargarita akajimensis (strain DSM 45221 / IAM 15411 / JCM 23193 / KCTC 12865 / 04OKA010-24) TaxID=583355 RepID=D5EQQ8_CORAD|nr:NAD(P)-dependent oxidoreductase [Coraliomargarita akajimensis]ADE55872.1 D-isomer specific 2-hydroxyacid dehydrogenase NAD-binding protein [Coraliomargarita akajimensis DSM 45221]